GDQTGGTGEVGYHVGAECLDQYRQCRADPGAGVGRVGVVRVVPRGEALFGTRGPGLGTGHIEERAQKAAAPDGHAGDPARAGTAWSTVTRPARRPSRGAAKAVAAAGASESAPPEQATSTRPLVGRAFRTARRVVATAGGGPTVSRARGRPRRPGRRAHSGRA